MSLEMSSDMSEMSSDMSDSFLNSFNEMNMEN